MKARIKSTGDIMPIAPYAKVTLDVCDDRGTPYEVDFEDVELINEDKLKDTTDWDSFRREVAKDILAGLASWNTEHNVSKDVQLAINYADVLTAKLKEK